MALEVIMPKAGVDMTEGQIVQWNKKVGEFVKEGEVLLEIMTDKVSMELEAEDQMKFIASSSCQAISILHLPASAKLAVTTA